MKVKLGIDHIDDNLKLFEGKRVGLITNPTGVNTELVSTIDILKKKTNLVALFSPEHGVRGNIQAGERLDTYHDEKTDCIVYSLYGSTKKPTKEMLDSIDVLCIDIQDVGSRMYTYIYTMAYAMEASNDYGKEFVVFDRPNPINGLDVEGNLLDINYKSFIGLYPICQRHGLTIGELAYLFNDEFKINCALTVIKMSGWERDMMFDETGLHWIFPSPNMPTTDTTLVYNATCVFEGTNISEGRGTTKPFEIVGAPWINPDELSDQLNSINLPGVLFRPLYFTPTFSKHSQTLCGGVELHITNSALFDTVKTGWTMLYVIKKLNPTHFEFNKPYKEGMHPMIDLNNGNSYLREETYSLKELYKILEHDAKKFIKVKENYHLY
ncbi:exo-beta-N-acetylmuramidase NamZ family protein [Haloplasma contractile]|uniref:DUF1343 domain-containing protein n=1 Tax=Haloplasma contractile SSD-17B TaxID=1033810 RepID=F7PUD2_9MOLU|nr:DUF1343 domain-containing protein [Haloplasma contractile]ERJ11743.1 hypothetical protein HLPCO_002226 [Haloplasma contractile SSD-17B]